MWKQHFEHHMNDYSSIIDHKSLTLVVNHNTKEYLMIHGWLVRHHELFTLSPHHHPTSATPPRKIEINKVQHITMTCSYQAQCVRPNVGRQLLPRTFSMHLRRWWLRSRYSPLARSPMFPKIGPCFGGETIILEPFWGRSNYFGGLAGLGLDWPNPQPYPNPQTPKPPPHPPPQKKTNN